MRHSLEPDSGRTGASTQADKTSHLASDQQPNVDIRDAVVDALFDPKSILKRIVRQAVDLFLSAPRFLFQALALILVAICAVRLIGLDPLFFVPTIARIASHSDAPLLREATWIQDDPDVTCISEAKRLGKAYALRRVFQYVDYEKSGQTLNVHERIIYDLLALRDIKSTDRLFLEEYAGSHRVAHWYGPRPEEGSGINKYEVKFDVNVGQTVTVVTGAEFRYELPLLPDRSAYPSDVSVGPNEDFWYYQNVDDVICRLDMLIDSRTVKLEPKGNGAAIKNDKGIVEESKALYWPNTYEEATNGSIQASWERILPNSNAGVVFKTINIQKPQPSDDPEVP